MTPDPEQRREFIPWGHKLTITIYRKGSPTFSWIDDLPEAVESVVGETHFIGLSVSTVDEEPVDQGGS